MTVDPNRIECDYCGHDTRGGRSHEHYDTYSDGLVTSLCCGCECARERAELAMLAKPKPRASPFDLAMASSVAALSVPWQLAWTITLREKPR